MIRKGNLPNNPSLNVLLKFKELFENVNRFIRLYMLYINVVCKHEKIIDAFKEIFMNSVNV